MISIVLAEDHHLVRQGISSILTKEPDMEIVGEAEDGNEVLGILEMTRPDLLILDVNMPTLGGIEVARELQSQTPRPHILFLSMYSDESLIKQAFRYGAKGYLLKSSVAEELLEAIRNTSKGELFLSKELRKDISIEMLRNAVGKSHRESTLTKRELQILSMVAMGKTNYSMAVELGISTKTIEKHRSRIMRKLGVQDLAGLIQKGIRMGLIS